MRIHHLSIEGRLFLRRSLAAAFMVVLLAEWGSHTFNHHPHGELFSVREGYALNTSQGGGHADSVLACQGHEEDHCPMMICNDSNRHDQQVPNAGHQMTPSNGALGGLLDFRPLLSGLEDPPL